MPRIFSILAVLLVCLMPAWASMAQGVVAPISANESLAVPDGPGERTTGLSTALQTPGLKAAGMDIAANAIDSAKSSILPDLTKRENLSAALQILILLTVLSLAPAILIMMTGFTRIVIVLSLLRQALGTQQLPPNQVLIGLALFMTFLVMQPTWTRVNNEALQPYMNGTLSAEVALDRAIVPVRDFMSSQIAAAGNDADIDVFTDFAGLPRAQRWDEVPTLALIPAFVLSELKTAFLLGFKIYLPFLVIDMVISSVLISMGMMMLPPVLISLPFKLLLFVLVDGWRLIVSGLMGSFIT